MTAPAPAPRLRKAPAPHTVRWLLRLHRPALYLWTGALVVVAAALLWLWGPLTDAAAEAWRQYNACIESQKACRYDQAAIIRFKDVYQYTTMFVLAVPFLVAAWAGAALTGRELETGTAQLAWTQAVSPTRWLAAKLAVPATLITGGTGLLVLLHHLAWSAGDGPIDHAKTWYDSATFYANGPITVALALAGLAAGALAGVLLRRSLAALVTAVIAVAGLWTALAVALPHLWPAATTVSSLQYDPSGEGIDVGTGLITSSGARIADPQCGSSIIPECRDTYARLDAVSYYHDYHPRSHFWPLQLTATGLLLAVAALLAVTAFALLRRRTGVPAPRRAAA
ncbi:ABC transporter permease [Streptomyces sp. HUAS ZL42]|uniref:ABC transporter permease n=1 Tax=Streptomyces sp. HUAS ZL42 TaxID=3231715 RepID=UPI00345EE960